MPRIKNIERDFTIHGNDKVLGSDGQDGSTKNYLVSDLANFIFKKSFLTISKCHDTIVEFLGYICNNKGKKMTRSALKCGKCKQSVEKT